MNGRPTLEDVARLAGTSVSTASVVLSGSKHKFVSEKLHSRVTAAANELQYRPNLAARRLKQKNGLFLAILVPQFDNVFFNQLVIGAETYASSRGYTLAIYSTYDQERKEAEFVDNLLSLQVDGVLIVPASPESEAIDMIIKAKLPFVVVDRAIPLDNTDQVTIDNYQAAKDATNYLIEHGHEDIAFFGWESCLTTITDRVKGFYDALTKAGIGPDPSAVVEVSRDRNEAFSAAMSVWSRSTFSAVLLGQSNVGEGVVDALFSLGKRIPEDVSAILYGDPPWASILRPKFDCIIQPHREMGAKAAQLIIDRLEDCGQAPSSYVFRASICKRESVRDLRLM